jgi:hypothetical protein
MPDFPLRILSHAVDTVEPTGDTMPKPVITSLIAKFQMMKQKILQLSSKLLTMLITICNFRLAT